MRENYQYSRNLESHQHFPAFDKRTWFTTALVEHPKYFSLILKPLDFFLSQLQVSKLTGQKRRNFRHHSSNSTETMFHNKLDYFLNETSIFLFHSEFRGIHGRMIYNLMTLRLLSLFSFARLSASSRERFAFFEKRRFLTNLASIWKRNKINIVLFQQISTTKTYTNARFLAFTFWTLDAIFVSLLVLIVIGMILRLRHFKEFCKK